ncbi:hypothetical protein NQ318_001016 [Aromia moschata]|uniref:Uncharacterized protein n=1 Tax=Aromia moschata TaxID=1265417 RepID=A0AAV8ZFY0_9CUCU|nr:hypothetical protein NQ318_001016 [Aromia moschata]
MSGRQDRYERMLSQGHKSALVPCKITRESQCIELKKKIVDMLKSGKKITLGKFALTHGKLHLTVLLSRKGTGVLRAYASPGALGSVSSVGNVSEENIQPLFNLHPEEDSDGAEQADHVEIVLKFLQKASNYLRTPFSVKAPSLKLENKDRAAIVAKQLNDFLYLYNRETEMFVDKAEKPSQIPTKLYNEFLENARECDLEEVLIYQTTQTTPNYGVTPGFQGILKCIPNAQVVRSEASLQVEQRQHRAIAPYKLGKIHPCAAVRQMKNNQPGAVNRSSHPSSHDFFNSGTTV